jgi:DNA-binding MarR family transcriptional regulator
MSVAPSQRHTRRNPCPICEGHETLRRHRGERCYGFTSEDGRSAFCTHDDYAGDLRPHAATNAYMHRLDGPCGCGRQHDGPAPIRQVRPSEPERAPRIHHGPFPEVMDGARLVATDPYADADGRVRYAVLRYEWPAEPGAKPEKSIRQVHPVGDGWVWGLGDTERILFNLPALAQAPDGDVLFITEGEPAARAIIRAGGLATTASEGKGKWTLATGRHEAVRRFHCVILPDHDDAGDAHARQIADDLAGVVPSTRIAELPGLPAHGDAVEWIAAGGTLVELLKLAIATPVEMPEPGTTPVRENPRDNVVIERKHNRLLESRLAWERTCRANANLSATTRQVAVALRDELDRTAPDGPAERIIWLPKLAEQAGISPQTASDHLKQLEAAHAIRRRVVKTRTDDGKTLTRIFVEPTPIFATPANWQLPMPRNHGGKREHCPQCGGDAVMVKRSKVCAGCGAVWDTSIQPVNEPMDEEDTNSQVDSLRAMTVKLTSSLRKGMKTPKVTTSARSVAAQRLTHTPPAARPIVPRTCPKVRLPDAHRCCPQGARNARRALRGPLCLWCAGRLALSPAA